MSQSDSTLRLSMWLVANQKRLIQAGLGLVVLALVVYAVLNYQESKEVAAGEALSKAVPSRLRETPAPGELAKALLQVANDHAGTQAALQATLRAGSALFSDGKFAEAQAQFEKFISAAPGSSFAPQAAYGIASCLDAAGKTTEAAAKYDEVIKRYSTDGIVEMAKLSLANLYAAQSKPEQAYKLYDELLQTARGAAGQEAFQHREELAQQFPYLRTNAPAIKPATTSLMNSATNVVKAASNLVQKAVSQATNAAAKP